MDSLDMALDKAKECENYFTSGGVDDDVIRKSEEILGIKFSKMQIKYYKKCEYLSFYGNEFKGLNPDDVNGETATNSISCALQERKKNLPKEWLPFYDYGFDGYMACVDFTDISNDGEPSVILTYYDGEKYIKTEKLADNIGDFILNVINGKL